MTRRNLSEGLAGSYHMTAARGRLSEGVERAVVVTILVRPVRRRPHPCSCAPSVSPRNLCEEPLALGREDMDRRVQSLLVLPQHFGLAARSRPQAVRQRHPHSLNLLPHGLHGASLERGHDAAAAPPSAADV